MDATDTSERFLRSTSRLPDVWYRWRWKAITRQILKRADEVATASDEELKRQCRECRFRVKMTSDHDELVFVDVFSLVREIAGRVHGIRHRPVQILGALAMSRGWIAEMRTGEGKTLTSLMTVTLLAAKNRGCHVITANDYLAARDCEFAKPVLDWFGLTTAVLQNEIPFQDRGVCYRSDVTYGSEKEFAFDFLLDRLNGLHESIHDSPLEKSRSRPIHTNAGSKIQNGHACALIDEADSILIDQASTPMIISCPQPASADEVNFFRWCDHVSRDLIAAVDFLLFPGTHAVKLTHRGCRKLRLTAKPGLVAKLPVESVFAQVERALAARHFFRPNREYLVIDKRLEIIDQGTGRVLPGRKWRDGLQQAIEIQAGLPLSDVTGSAARVTLQNYFNNYEFMCGMTGTAAESRRELNRTYRLRVMTIATNSPCRLHQLPSRIFPSNDQKWSAIVAETERLVASGRALLVGTTSIVTSEQCASQLRTRGLEVQVLHAMHHKEEAEIVRQAGQPGRITVATNMAGRGTDIKLHPTVRDAGGLHVILCEMNRSARIDRQLAGRAARNGDPGSWQIFVSLEDELLLGLGANIVSRLKGRSRNYVGHELPASWISYFKKAQQRFERRGERERRELFLREQEHALAMSALGLDPYIDLPTDQ